MKRLTLLVAALLISLCGFAQTTLTINPGWNWFSYTNPTAVDIGTAFSPIPPRVGDVAKSLDGSFAVYTSNGWSGNLTQLEPGRAYHYYSRRNTSTTLNLSIVVPPSVVTEDAIVATLYPSFSSAAVGNGLHISARGLCWATHSAPTTADSHTSDGTGNGFFKSEPTGLQVNTTYYFRAYATNAAGTTYGEESSFTTPKWLNSGTEGALPGLFSVAQGKGVRFSQGNLQYQASSDTWRFAEHQYDRIGRNNRYVSDTYSGWIDLFGWGTSGINHGAVCYQPWSTSMEHNNYQAYGNGLNDLFSLSGIADWGHNVIGNGDTQEGLWRTLTREEWDYLLNTRTTSSGIRYVKATVAGTKGLILPSDNFPGGIYNFSSPNDISTSYDLNSFTAAELETMEALGIVFLPVAGYRWNTLAEHYDTYGYYWSSVGYHDNMHVGQYEQAYAVSFDESNLIRTSGKGYGIAVRLVHDMSNEFSVITKPIALVTATTVNTGGIVTTYGSGTLHRGVCWDTIPQPTIDAHFVDGGTTQNDFNCQITGLKRLTTYYIRSYAYYSESDIHYGNEYCITTPKWAQDGIVGMMTHEFTVSATGNRVYFSQGNLQYQASTNTWRFAENEYDRMGNGNANIASNYSGWIDLFGWGTSGYNHGATCYQPWSTSTTNSSYWAYGDRIYHLFSQTGRAEWGYNAISNGDNREGLWRTLTRQEWNYLLFERSADMRFVKATVDGVPGLLIFPDGFGGGALFQFNQVNNASASFDSNVHEATWLNMMELFGAVFLPVMGYRNGTTLTNIDTEGFYWSSTADESDYATFASAMWFSDDGCQMRPLSRSIGRAVRLVRVKE